MKKTIEHLPIEKQNELNEIVDLVTNNPSINMIILFGSYARGDWVEDKYKENGTTYEYKSDYDLLFVVEDEAKAHSNRFAKQIRRKIKKNIETDTAINVIYHGIDYLNTEIEDGNYFFIDILKEGICLYNTKKYVLSKPKQLSTNDRIRKAQMYFSKWMKNANEFLIDFNNAFERVSYSKAAFELHQATERYFMTVLLVLTDYKPKIHDLGKLRNMVIKLDARFKPIFPQQTKEEERLFTLLKKAYIDSRYKMDYEIKKTELEYLSKRVKLLQTLTEKICKEKIEQLIEQKL